MQQIDPTYSCMVLQERPLSLRSAKADGYRNRLKDTARHRTAVIPHFGQANLFLNVVWFHREPAGQDVDNILKHIADGLKEIVYSDDATLIGCAAERVDLRERYEVQAFRIDPDVEKQLAEWLDEPEVKHVLFVEVVKTPLVGLRFVDIGFSRLRTE